MRLAISTLQIHGYKHMQQTEFTKLLKSGAPLEYSQFQNRAKGSIS
jgi:hypothetical protein